MSSCSILVEQNLTPLGTDWWTGTNPQGQRGLFPANYVTLLEGGAAEEEEPAPPAAPTPPPMPSREEPAAADKGKWAIAQYE